VRDVASGLRLATATWRFWMQRGYLREGRDWLERLLALDPGDVSTVRAKALIALGGLTYWLNDPDATEGAYHSAVDIFRSLEDRRAEAEALYNIAFVPVMRGDTAEARRRFETSLSLARELGLPKLVAVNESSLGITMVVDGDPEAALPILDDALQFFWADGDRFQAAWALAETAQAHRALGRFREARADFLASLRLHAEAMNLPGIGAILNALAALDAENGHFAQAIRLSGAARTLISSTGASAPALFTRVENVEQLARKGMGDAAVDSELAVGRAMTTDEAIAYALSTEDATP
jgi:non-specific serine/threonine protein kinase